MHTEADCPPSTSRRPRRRGNGIKNARRRDEGRSQRANGANCPPSASETSKAAGKRDKNARRRGEERQGLACKRRQNAHRQRRDVQGGGETG
ncbi:MAG: hypothetical protein ACLR23_12070 [Clostridia bacterium]